MSEHQGQTDQIHEVKLTSVISQAMWDRPMSWAGEDVGILVFTHFVGDGSEIRITIRNDSGSRLDRVEDKVYGDRFKGTWTISDKAKDAIYFEAELRKHGLKKESEKMRIIPPIEITNAKWSQQEARRGDILTLTADVKEVPDGTEALIEIYEHDADGAHDLITKFPVIVESNKIETEWQFEYYDDTIDIPRSEESEGGYKPPQYFFRASIGKISADSELLKFKDWIEIELRDSEENSMADVEYTLKMPDGSEKTGNLDSEGKAKEENIPPGKILVAFSDLEKFQEIKESEIIAHAVAGEIGAASGDKHLFKTEPFIFSA